MNIAEFVQKVAGRNNISEKEAYQYVTATMDTIRVILSEGEKLDIGGFGKFLIVHNLCGERIPVFIAGKTLKKAINADK